MSIINNLSYTNKDFGSVYPELLDLTKKLTNKWDPTISNESDPGVVLLKENAIIADKSNYNIDKNVLELMPLSVTQRGNAMQIYDFSGYHMHWYKSAATSISVTYNGGLDATASFIIPRFTMVTNANSTVVYTINREIAVDADHRTNIVPVIQGIITDYEVNGISEITLLNLDADLRLYFPETMVAENGIFIANVSTTGSDWDSWEAVDNLESTVLNSKVYKFGVVPNSNLCYLQFPQDIAGLIGGGIKIKYIISSGESGNIVSYELSEFYSEVTPDGLTEPINDDIIITNDSSAMDGADPESLDEAYNNYKKTVGTFNTLVTCRDYSNAIFNLEDNGEPYVSNCVVSDRTNDINNSNHIMTLSTDGSKKLLSVKSSRKAVEAFASEVATSPQTVYVDTPAMSAYDIALYILSPMKNIYTEYYYDRSFMPAPIQSEIEELLEGQKSSQHNYYVNTSLDEPYIYKNFYTLTGKIITFYKVTSVEASDIETNVKVALMKKFNARQVNFGEPVSYDNIISVIQGADTRIKSVILNEPVYQLRKMSTDDTSGKYSASESLSDADNNKLVARMVLAGTVQLFKFDEDFNYEFGQTATTTYKSISSIDTEVSIPAVSVSSGSGYELKENENIQLYAPNLVTTTEYTTYVKYQYTSTSGTPTIIPDSAEYQLQPDEKLTFTYTDTNNTIQTKVYTEGTIVRITGFGATGLEETTDTVTALQANQSIAIREVNSTTFNSALNCIWYTNNVNISSGEKKYILFTAGSGTSDRERILQNNEYFIYTNADKSELVILGSGTKISRAAAGAEVSIKNQVDLSSIISDGQAAVGDTEWYTYNGHAQSTPNPLTITELQIVTLAQGAVFKGTAVDGDITNTAQTVLNPKYKGVGGTEFVPLTHIGIDGGAWKVLSRLNINATTTTPQTLLENQSVTLHYSAPVGGTANLAAGESILFSSPVFLSGGSNLDTLVLNSDGTYTNSLNAFAYTAGALPAGIERGTDGYIKVGYSAASVTLNFDFKQVTNADTGCYIIPVIKNGSTAAVTFSNCTLYAVVDNPDAEDIQNAGTYYLQVAPAGGAVFASISVSWALIGDATSSSDFVSIGKIYKLDGYSAQVDASLVPTEDTVIDNIKALDKDKVFDYTYKIDEADGIDTVILDTDTPNSVMDPKAFWDTNHICNRFTIPQMNTDSYNIKVSSSSRL